MNCSRFVFSFTCIYRLVLDFVRSVKIGKIRHGLLWSSLVEVEGVGVLEKKITCKPDLKMHSKENSLSIFVSFDPIFLSPNIYEILKKRAKHIYSNDKDSSLSLSLDLCLCAHICFNHCLGQVLAKLFGHFPKTLVKGFLPQVRHSLTSMVQLWFVSPCCTTSRKLFDQNAVFKASYNNCRHVTLDFHRILQRPWQIFQDIGEHICGIKKTYID